MKKKSLEAFLISLGNVLLLGFSDNKFGKNGMYKYGGSGQIDHMFISNNMGLSCSNHSY